MLADPGDAEPMAQRVVGEWDVDQARLAHEFAM